MLELSIVYYAEHRDVNSHHRQVTFTHVVWTLHSSHAWDFKVQQWLNLRTWGVNNLLSIEALNQTFHGQSSTPSTPQSKLLRGYLIRHSSTGGHSDWGFRGEQLSIKELLMWFVWTEGSSSDKPEDKQLFDKVESYKGKQLLSAGLHVFIPQTMELGKWQVCLMIPNRLLTRIPDWNLSTKFSSWNQSNITFWALTSKVNNTDYLFIMPPVSQWDILGGELVLRSRKNREA